MLAASWALDMHREAALKKQKAGQKAPGDETPVPLILDFLANHLFLVSLRCIPEAL